MSKVLNMAIEKETKRNNGAKLVTNAEDLVKLNRDIQQGTVALQKNESIIFDAEHCRLSKSVINGAEFLTLLCLTSQGRMVTFWPSSVWKQRTLWEGDENGHLGDLVSNHDNNPVGEFYSKCPNQIVFLAHMMGKTITATEDAPRVRVAGFDSANNRASEDFSTTQLTRFQKFSCRDRLSVEEIKDEYLGEGGTTKAAEDLLNYYKSAE